MINMAGIEKQIAAVKDNTEKQETLSQEDKDMDIRAKEAVKAALEKAKVCKKPIARYDIETKRAYIEDPEGNRRYVE